MFGYLRFFLAFLVMLSHIGVRFYTLNPGVIAVIIFYILAGYVVSHLYRDILVSTKNTLFTFYKDRFLRIFPLYLYVIAITLIFLLLTSFANPKFTFLNLLSNLTIIPLNYYMLIDSTVLTTPNWWLVPPAWSLGTELQAYILLPFAIMLKRLKIVLAIFSLGVYTVANFAIIDPDYFGYRLIVGVFFIFLLGSAIQSYKTSDKYFIIFIYIGLLMLLAIFTCKDSFSPTYTKETIIGVLVGVPLVLFISKTNVKIPFNSTLGSLSYALFLTHFLAIWILQYIGTSPMITFSYIAKVTSIALFISIIGIYSLEKSITKIRYIYT